MNYKFSPKFESIKGAFDCFNSVQKYICNSSGTIEFKPTLSISCNGKYTCCEKKDVILLGGIVASGGLEVFIPKIESKPIPIPITNGAAQIKVSVGFFASLAFSGSMQSTCTLPAGVFALNGSIGVSGGGTLQAFSENIASVSGSLSSSGDCVITYTLKSGEESGNWDVKNCSISYVKANYIVTLLTYEVYEGTADLYKK